jgi:hypothetical protein
MGVVFANRFCFCRAPHRLGLLPGHAVVFRLSLRPGDSSSGRRRLDHTCHHTSLLHLPALHGPCLLSSRVHARRLHMPVAGLDVVLPVAIVARRPQATALEPTVLNCSSILRGGPCPRGAPSVPLFWVNFS